MSKPLVSIIIPNYNKAPYIREAIESALNQTYKNIEVIVVDDGSTDESKEIIKSFGKKIKAYFLPHKNANVARNFGFKKSKGKYIQFLDSDDIILPEKIEKQVELLEKTGAEMALCGFKYLIHIGEKNILKGPVYIEDRYARDLLLLFTEGSLWYPPFTPLYRRELVEASGGWNESLELTQDLHFDFQIASLEPYVENVKLIGGLYRRYKGKKEGREWRLKWNICADATLEYLYSIVQKKRPELTKYLAKYFLIRARGWYEFDKDKYVEKMKILFKRFPTYKPREFPVFYILSRLFGYKIADAILYRLRKVKHVFRPEI